MGKHNKRVAVAAGGVAIASLLSGAAVLTTATAGATPYGDGVTVSVDSAGGGAAAANAATTIQPTGQETLADAITYLNANGGGQIGFASTLSGDTVDLTVQLPEITAPTVIYGIDSSKTTIDGGGSTAHLGSVFRVAAGIAGSQVQFNDLTIENGFTTGNGAAIDALSGIELGSVVLAHNTAAGSASLGGAVYAPALSTSQADFEDNTATSAGGAIYMSKNGEIDLEYTTVAGNASRNGGGIATDAARQLRLDFSTISGNTASNNFGGVNAQGAPAGVSGNSQFLVASSTIANNKAASSGGGFLATSHKVLLLQDTIVHNQAKIDGGVGFSPKAGGTGPAFGSLTVQDSIVAANVANSYPDIQLKYGGKASAKFSLFGSAQGSGITAAGANIVGTTKRRVKPILGTLANNGGFTKTYLPLKGSPVLDQGFSFNEANDQRGDKRTVSLGLKRPKGGDGTDIGSVELQSKPS